MESGRQEGFGDTIELITKFTGIKKIVNGITNGNCGCEKRKEWLNQKIPYNKK